MVGGVGGCQQATCRGFTLSSTYGSGSRSSSNSRVIVDRTCPSLGFESPPNERRSL